MSCVPAPAAKAVLAQANARWPNRSRASDGICPSATHTRSNPTSDHERGMAVDLTHDPANGCDAHAWVETLRQRRDPRVKYIISNRRICASYPVAGYPSWAWRQYNGTNPHSSHAHVSLKDGAQNDTSPWFLAVASSSPPAPAQEDDDLTPEQAADLIAIKNYVVDAQARLVDHDNDIQDLKNYAIDIQARVAAIAAKVGA